MTNDQMHDQQHHDHVVAINPAPIQMAKTTPQSFLEADLSEEMLKQNKPRVRGQVLRLKAHIQIRSRFTSNSRLAMFHVSGLCRDWHVVLVDVHCTNREATFLLEVPSSHTQHNQLEDT